jgi:hypothetical protein
MNVDENGLVETMRELNVANALLGDRAALRERWEADGYLFFRDVLDHAPLERMRNLMLGHLERNGFVDASDPEVRWSGKARENFSFFPVKEMNDIRAARTVMEDEAVRRFFQRLFGAPLYWVPFTEYRTTPPAVDRARSRFDFVHEDAIYSDRLDFIICWVPLSDIDAQVGGLAVAEGLHRLPCLHKKEGDKINPIDPGSVPVHAWRRANYQLGDVLLMSRRTPHSGLSNHSERFRLSFDTRVLPQGGAFPYPPRLPYVGTLASISHDQIVISDAQGEHILKMDETSYIRGFNGNRLTSAEVLAIYTPGFEVIAAYEGDLLQTLRPQH